MLHRPPTHFPSASPPPASGLEAHGRPIFDAAAYVDAMRALGATLHPERGTPGGIDPDGTYRLELPADPQAHRRAEAVDKAFAPLRA